MSAYKSASPRLAVSIFRFTQLFSETPHAFYQSHARSLRGKPKTNFESYCILRYSIRIQLRRNGMHLAAEANRVLCCACSTFYSNRLHTIKYRKVAHCSVGLFLTHRVHTSAVTIFRKIILVLKKRNLSIINAVSYHGNAQKIF